MLKGVVPHGRSVRRVLSRSGVLIVGEVIAAGIGLAMLALLAQALGPKRFGILAAVLAYGQAIDLVFNFQTWRTLVRFGAECSENLNGCVRFCLTLDIGSAVMAFGIAVLLSGPAASYVDGLTRELLVIYAVTILVNITGHATGILQLFGRFAFIGAHKVLLAVLRITAVAAAILQHEPMVLDVVVALAVAECAGRCVLVARGWVELRRQRIGFGTWQAMSAFRTANPSALDFSIFSNINDTVLKVAQQIDVFVIGGLLSTVDAGFLRIIKSLGSILSMVTQSISQVVFPEMTKLFSGDRNAMRPFLRTLFFGLGVGALTIYTLFLAVGQPVIGVIFGEEYQALYGAAAVFLAGAAVGMTLLPLTPLLLVTGRQRQLFVAYLAASVAYLVALVGGAQAAGLFGAAFSLPALYAAYALTIYISGSWRGV